MPAILIAQLLPLLICLLVSVVHAVPSYIHSWDDDPNVDTLVELAGAGLVGAQKEYCPGCMASRVDPDAVIPGIPPTRITQLGQQDALAISPPPPHSLEQCVKLCTEKFQGHVATHISRITRAVVERRDGGKLWWRLNLMELREESLELECAKLHNQPQDTMAPKPISKARHVTTWLPRHPSHRFGLPYHDDEDDDVVEQRPYGDDGEVQSNDDGEKQRPYYDGGGEE